MTLIRLSLVAALMALLGLPRDSPAENGENSFRQSRTIMGTSVEITVSQVSAGRAERAMAAAFGEVEKVDRLMSHYREESEVSRISRNAGIKEIRVSSETLEVIERSIYFANLSQGAFDVTIGPVFRLWKFREGKIPEERSLRENLGKVDYRGIRVDRARSSVFLERPGMDLDLGAIAKGYGADRAAAALLRGGVENFIVAISGDMALRGSRDEGTPWDIGVRHPRLASQLMARLRPAQGGVATSGDYQKFFIQGGERYHHLLNPRTGMPARECQSATILAPSAMDADALATAVFILGPQKGMAMVERLPGVHALVVDQRGSALASPGWPAGVLLPP